MAKAKETISNKVFMLLDRSGSMATMWEQALSSINSYVEKLKNADVMLAVFDTQSYDIVRNCATNKWKPISADEIQPRGGTPLLDAAGRMIWNMLDSNSDRAILVVITDGHENSSNYFKASDIKELTKNITNRNYDIVFLGANFDNIAEVAKTNFGWNDQSRIVPTTTRGFAQAMNATLAGTQAYFETGATAKAFYSEKDKAAAKQ